LSVETPRHERYQESRRRRRSRGRRTPCRSSGGQVRTSKLDILAWRLRGPRWRARFGRGEAEDRLRRKQIAPALHRPIRSLPVSFVGSMVVCRAGEADERGGRRSTKAQTLAPPARRPSTVTPGATSTSFVHLVAEMRSVTSPANRGHEAAADAVKEMAPSETPRAESAGEADRSEAVDLPLVRAKGTTASREDGDTVRVRPALPESGAALQDDLAASKRHVSSPESPGSR